MGSADVMSSSIFYSICPYSLIQFVYIHMKRKAVMKLVYSIFSYSIFQSHCFLGKKKLNIVCDILFLKHELNLDSLLFY